MRLASYAACGKVSSPCIPPRTTVQRWTLILSTNTTTSTTTNPLKRMKTKRKNNNTSSISNKNCYLNAKNSVAIVARRQQVVFSNFFVNFPLHCVYLFFLFWRHSLAILKKKISVETMIKKQLIEKSHTYDN